MHTETPFHPSFRETFTVTQYAESMMPPAVYSLWEQLWMTQHILKRYQKIPTLEKHTKRL